MAISVSEILDLVGKLDDSPGDDVPRERFRTFLRKNVQEVGQVRDYVQECLRETGVQYNCALQDLVNHLATFLGFEVTFGRYRGVQGQIGFDGHWVSPTGFHIVAEVKTTEVYAVKTSALLGYVDDLISAQSVPTWDHALGLYVVGRPDPELRHLESAIIAERRANQLRIVSVESLLSLAEMMNEYDVEHEDILAVLRPSGPNADAVIDLMARLVAESTSDQPIEPKREAAEEEPEYTAEGESVYWLTPVKSDEEQTAEQVVNRLVVENGIYAWAERTPGRKHLKPGDWMCFYATGKGVIGHARVVSDPKEMHHPAVRQAERYCWVFQVESAEFYPESPIVIDGALRSLLEAFEGRDPEKSWAWFVQGTHKLTEHDFTVLTSHAGGRV